MWHWEALGYLIQNFLLDTSAKNVLSDQWEKICTVHVHGKNRFLKIRESDVLYRTVFSTRIYIKNIWTNRRCIFHCYKASSSLASVISVASSEQKSVQDGKVLSVKRQVPLSAVLTQERLVNITNCGLLC